MREPFIRRQNRPIIFSAPMVQALLAGQKTQTRRVIKKATHDGWYIYQAGKRVGWSSGGITPGARNTPYAIGDRLFVREAHYLTDDGDEECAVYAGDTVAAIEHFDVIRRMQKELHLSGEWAAPHLRLRPSIHMPRWASRLTLAVTDVRVQRLQDIGEADAVARLVKNVKNMADPK